MKVLVLAPLVFVVAAACGSSGGKTPAATTSSTGAPTTTTTVPLTSSTTSPTPTTVAAGPQPGPGSVTLNVRGPIPFSGTVPTSVVCDTERGHYAAEASGFTVGQDTVSISVNIAGYGSPKVYSTPVTIEFLGPDGTSDKVTETIGVNIVNPKQGQFTITGTDDLGKKVDADVNFWCS